MTLLHAWGFALTFSLIASVAVGNENETSAVVALNETVQFLIEQLQTTKDELEDAKSGLDTTWLFLTGVGIFSMQVGFSLVEAGTIQAKSVQSVILKNLTDNLIGGVTWYLVGYGMYTGSGKIIGTEKVYYLLNEPEYFLHFFQQYGFSITACTIVSGAILGRVRFQSYLAFSGLFLLYVYPVAAHAAWTSGGFLFERGYIDFAGSGVIHELGGFAAIVGAYMCGPRVGRFYPKEKGEKRLMVRSLKITSATSTNLGGFILYINWFHFNCGSTLQIHDTDSQALAARAAVNTLICSCVSGTLTTVYLIGFCKYQDVGTIMNSILLGLVAITAGCASVDPWAAVIIGVLSSFAHINTSYFILHVLNIDDPLDAFTVHGIGGFLGVVCVGLFNSDAGLLTMGQTELFVTQLLGALFYGFFGLANSALIFSFVRVFSALRVSDEEQLVGLDMLHHDSHVATLDEYEARERNLRKDIQERLGHKLKKKRMKKVSLDSQSSASDFAISTTQKTSKITPVKEK